MVAQQILVLFVQVRILIPQLYMSSWESGHPAVCKTAYTGSSPVLDSIASVV